MQNTQLIPRDPSLPPVPPPLPELYRLEYCDCRKPVPVERASRRGAAHTYCARCDRELPLTLDARWR
jgi:hypothetical protein